MKRRAVLLGLFVSAKLARGRARAPGLAITGPVHSTADHQVIENLDISAPSGDALVISHRGVIVRNCRIAHNSGHGVNGDGAAGLVLQDIEVICVDSSVTQSSRNNVNLVRCQGAMLMNIKAVRGSSNIYIEEGPDCRLRNLELHDARGPYPRGQNVQLNRSPRCLVEDFSGENGPQSWTEDNVSVFRSDQCTVRRGVVYYNNSPTGDGVMLEGSSRCVVEDVDAIEQGNGAFAAVPSVEVGSGGCVFLRCRTRASYNSPRDGRPAPESKGLSFYMVASAGAPKHTIAACYYDQLANSRNLVWDLRSVNKGWSLLPMAFTPRPFVRLNFAWS